MAKLGKRTRAAREAFAGKEAISLEDAVALIKGNANAKFDETLEIAMNLGVDPRHADQMVRGVVTLPNGTGKTVRVAVFARGPKAEEAQAAGADIVGAEDLMETIQGGKIEFDRCIATPDMMPIVGRLGKILGPRNLMPNPKVGTVTMDVAEAVKNAKGGEGAVQGREGRRGACRRRQGVVRRRASWRRTCVPSSTRSPGQAVRCQGVVSEACRAELDHGAGRERGDRRARRPGSTSRRVKRERDFAGRSSGGWRGGNAPSCPRRRVRTASRRPKAPLNFLPEMGIETISLRALPSGDLGLGTLSCGPERPGSSGPK